MTFVEQRFSGLWLYFQTLGSAKRCGGAGACPRLVGWGWATRLLPVGGQGAAACGCARRPRAIGLSMHNRATGRDGLGCFGFGLLRHRCLGCKVIPRTRSFYKTLCKYLCRSYPQGKFFNADNDLRAFWKTNYDIFRANYDIFRANHDIFRAVSTV